VSEFLRQVPFLIAVFALSLGLFPDEVLGWFDDEFDVSDLFYLLVSAVVFVIGLTTAYIVMIESFRADPEPLPQRDS
jgi:hypothetical protein